MREREVKRKGEGRGKEGGQAGRCTQELDTSVQDTPPAVLCRYFWFSEHRMRVLGQAASLDCLIGRLPSLLLGWLLVQ